MAERIHVGGITDTVMTFENDGTIFVEDKQDAAGILEYTKACRDNRYSGMSSDGDMTHVAEIPMTLMMEWSRQHGNMNIFSNEFSIIMEKKLQDPQYAYLLAAPKLNDAHIIMKGIK